MTEIIKDSSYEDAASRGDSRMGPGGKTAFSRRKVCRFCGEQNVQIDYKSPHMLKHFITDRGKILPRRLSGNCSKHQRKVSLAIKQARVLALMPFTVTGR